MFDEKFILELKEKIAKGASFLSCISLVQKRYNISLKDAKELLLSLDIYSKEQKDKIVCQIELMKSEYENK